MAGQTPRANFIFVYPLFTQIYIYGFKNVIPKRNICLSTNEQI